MSALPSNNISNTSPREDYEWRYEYYEDDEPVSFEGLKAHRYSIVIGFWVGLAVFVLFMFFVLTLLTKTGAPHPENSEQCEKRACLTSCGEDMGHLSEHQGSPPGVSRPLLDESRSLFHCYINEDQQAANGRSSGATAHPGGVRGSGGGRPSAIGGQLAGLVQEAWVNGAPLPERDPSTFLAHFNIPNFVNSELSSTLGDDDLLLVDPPLILDREDRGPNGARGDHTLDSSSSSSSVLVLMGRRRRGVLMCGELCRPTPHWASVCSETH
ncbi:melanocortin-2 receptor accessory protein 2A [Sardina pilchardus]|uniref:melanocortin-2 receptor accessory protein 2A n=1 Tax=Sardina pilchardus TaxID=27697 RepID=UPI002E0DB18A